MKLILDDGREIALSDETAKLLQADLAKAEKPKGELED